MAPTFVGVKLSWALHLLDSVGLYRAVEKKASTGNIVFATPDVLRASGFGLGGS
jgi:hypothetical protein